LTGCKGRKNVVLIFYSDNTWGACRRQLGQLQKQISDIEKLNTKVIAISTTGNQQDVEKSKENIEITYVLIPTPNRKVVEEYGLSYNSSSCGGAYATFIIDTKGHVRFKHVETVNTRTSVSEIIKELQIIQWCDTNVYAGFSTPKNVRYCKHLCRIDRPSKLVIQKRISEFLIELGLHPHICGFQMLR
jgi:peroxiredoxin